MNGFVLVIVGQVLAPDGLHVSIAHGTGSLQELKPRGHGRAFFEQVWARA
jgi:hypothetical protein